MASHDIRRARPADAPLLLALWERSVRATHHFVTDEDIALYRPLVERFLADPSTDLWVIADAADVPLGFLALAGQAIDALFLEPSHRRRGFGRQLVAHAQHLRPGALTVEVNEENESARRFYESLGFVVFRRSPIDDYGRPHPVLHLTRS